MCRIVYSNDASSLDNLLKEVIRLGVTSSQDYFGSSTCSVFHPIPFFELAKSSHVSLPFFELVRVPISLVPNRDDFG